jgi:hypothetical protein
MHDSWYVKSSRIGGELVFHVGLPQYAYAIGLKERDVLIFKVKGDPVINRKICDTRDSTERVISFLSTLEGLSACLLDYL